MTSSCAFHAFSDVTSRDPLEGVSYYHRMNHAEYDQWKPVCSKLQRIPVDRTGVFPRDLVSADGRCYRTLHIEESIRIPNFIRSVGHHSVADAIRRAMIDRHQVVYRIMVFDVPVRDCGDWQTAKSVINFQVARYKWDPGHATIVVGRLA